MKPHGTRTLSSSPTRLTKVSTRHSSLEPLESRIAPAAAFVTYTDIDGDQVKITASTGPLDLADLTFVGGGTSGQLAKLDLTDADFVGAKISFSVVKKGDGDGLVNVGYIEAPEAGFLNSVSLNGDLGRIDGAMFTLSVGSLGLHGLTTQGGTGSLTSNVGAVDILTVKRDIVDATFNCSSINTITVGGSLIGGEAEGSGSILAMHRLGNITIGHDLIGGTGDRSGSILATTPNFGSMGKVKIAGSMYGGAGEDSGAVKTASRLASISVGRHLVGGLGEGSGSVFATGSDAAKVGGSLRGGAGDGSGSIDIQLLGAMTIGKDVRGGDGEDSGSILGGGRIGVLKIGRDLIGGDGDGSGRVLVNQLPTASVGDDIVGGQGNNSGAIFAGIDDFLGTLTVGGDVIGGSISGIDSLENSGGIFVTSADKITIGGSIVAGFDASTGTLTHSGAIIAGDIASSSPSHIGSLTINGSIVGNSTHAVVISALGPNPEPTPTSILNLAIGQLNVGKHVNYAQILAGFDADGAPANADAMIGKVVVGGHWRASSMVAGVQDSGAPGYGVGDTVQTVMDDPVVTAQIMSITIKGFVSGSLTAGDNFGFVAQKIGAVKISGKTIALNPTGTDNILLPSTNDVHILEV